MYDKMNSVVNYTSSLTSEPFLYEETKSVITLRLQGYSDNEIKAKVLDENIWGCKSMKQAKRLIPVVLRRLIFLDEKKENLLVNGNMQESKIICLYLVMKNNLLFSEFINEVYLRKFESNDKIITIQDIKDFFEKKKQSSKIVEKWKPNVFIKLSQVYINILFQVSLVNDRFIGKGVGVGINENFDIGRIII